MSILKTPVSHHTIFQPDKIGANALDVSCPFLIRHIVGILIGEDIEMHLR